MKRLRISQKGKINFPSLYVHICGLVYFSEHLTVHSQSLSYKLFLRMKEHGFLYILNIYLLKTQCITGAMGIKLKQTASFLFEICSKVMEGENIHNTEKNNIRQTIHASRKSTIYTSMKIIQNQQSFTSGIGENVL